MTVESPGGALRRKALLLCRDRVEYAASVVDRGELEARLGPFVPVLLDDDPPDEAFDSPRYEGSASLASLASLADRELFEACWDTLLPSPAGDQEPICAYVPGDTGALCAAVFAAFSGRRLVPLDRSLALDVRPSSIAVIVSTDVLAVHGTEWLQRRLRSLLPAAPPFGILTAQGDRELSRFVARCLRRVAPARSVAEVTWIPEAKPYGFDEDRTTPFSCMRAMPEGTADSEVLFFRGHGREYCANSGRLCSRRVRSDEMRTCIRGLECISDEWARSPASDVRGDIVFLENCKGGRFLGGVDPQQNLATLLIEGGASAVFASAGRYYADELTPLLALRLMAGGWTFGHVAQALNGFLRQKFGTLEHVLLFGDPEGIPFEPCDPLPELEVSTGSAGEQRFRVETSLRSDAEFFLVRGVGAIFDGPITCVEHPAHPVTTRSLLLGLDEQHAVMVVLGGRGATGEFVFRRRSLVDLTVMSSASRFVERLMLLSSGEDALVQRRAAALGQLLQDTGAMFATAARAGAASMEENARLLALERNITHAASDLAVQHARVCGLAVATFGWLDALYGQQGRTDHLPETTSPSVCPTCGLPLLACHYRVFGVRSDSRERLECERCGVVCDILQGSSLVWAVAPAKVALGHPFEVRVHGTNGSDEPLYLGVAGTIGYVDPSKYELNVVTCPAVVAAGESFTLVLHGRVDESVRANIYDLRILMSMNGALALANRSVMYTRT